MTKIKVGIVGAAGYTGSELLRLLVNHPKVEISFAISRTFASQKISKVLPDLIGDIDLCFTEKIDPTVNLIYLCLPHKASQIWVDNNSLADTTKIIDLGNDFRINTESSIGNFIYGLPEVNLEKIKNAKYIANPGCFATAIQLALLPLAQNHLLKQVYTTGITGSTGAGAQLQGTSHFSWRNNNISAYKTLNHQHVDEILSTLENLNHNKINLNFVPWRGDFTRGIFTSSTIESVLTLEEANEIYQQFYKNNPFIFISNQTIDLKQVVNTNKALVHIEKKDNQLVIHSIIDNLLKGASGQAIQNMNLMFGWEQNLGLMLKASVY